MDFLRNLITSGTFWTAVAAVAAILALIPLALAAGRYLRDRNLADFLKRERIFYREPAARRDRELVKRYARLAERPYYEDVEDRDRMERYLQAVKEGVKGLDTLPRAELEKTKTDIRQLLRQLRTTHQTLVNALELFGTEDVERFFKEFDNFRNRFSSLYSGGQIPSDARTHCSEVQELVWKLNSQIDNGATGLDKIQNLGNSVVVMDREVIIPVMSFVLEQAALELELIAHAMRTGDKRKAIWLKERYWFDVQSLYDEIRDTLNSMDEVVSKF